MKTRSFQENSPVMKFIKHRLEENEIVFFSLFSKTHLSILPNGLFLSNIQLPFIQNCTEIWPSWCLLGYSAIGNIVKMWKVRELQDVGDHLYPVPVGREHENILDCDEYPLTHWDLVLSSSDWQKQLGDGVVLAWYSNNIWDHLVYAGLVCGLNRIFYQGVSI